MKKLRFQPRYKLLSQKFKEENFNGAGATKFQSLVIPNSFFGLDCTEVFYIHDYDYIMGKTWEDKYRADVNMLLNLITMIESGSKLLYIPRKLQALVYFNAVVLYGSKYFFSTS